MELSIQDLDELVKSFALSSNDDERRNIEEILAQWNDSLDTLPTALEILQSSNVADLLLFASAKVKHNLQKNLLDQEEERLNEIVNVCIQRIISNKSNIRLPKNVLNYLFELIAIVTFIAPSFYDLIMNSPQFSQDEQLGFLSYLFSTISQQEVIMMDSESPRAELFEFLRENISDILDLLMKYAESNTNVSYYWVLLHCYLLKFIQSYTALQCFIPYIESALEMEDSNIISTILDFYDRVVQTEDTDDYPYIKALIKPMIDYAVSAFNSPNEDKIQNASFIWDKTIDLTFEFYGFDQINDNEDEPLIDSEFINFVFSTFVDNLQNFLFFNTDEFFHLLDIYTSCLYYQPDGVTLPFMEDYITEALEFIIEQIDAVSDLEIPREDNLRPYCLCCPEMDYCLSTLMRLECEQDNNKEYQIDQSQLILFKQFSQFLSVYFSTKIQNLTNGVLYVFSFAPKQTRQNFTSSIGLIIKEMEETLVTSIYFIASCCHLIPEFEKDEINLTFTIAEMEYAPQYEVSKALVKLSEKYATSFIEDNDGEYIQYLLKMISETEMNSVSSDLFITMFNVLYCFQEKFESEEEQTIQTIEDLFDRVRTLFAEKITSHQLNCEISSLKTFNDFIIPIISKSQNANDIMTTYYSSLYEVVEEELTPLIYTDDLEFHQEVCNLIEAALSHNWVGNKEPYFRWIEDIIEVESPPQAIYFKILSNLIEFLPSQKITEILSGMDQYDIDIVKSIIPFLIQVLNVNPDIMTELVSLDQILSPLELNDPNVIDEEFQLLISFIENPDFEISVDDANKIAQLASQRMFTMDFLIYQSKLILDLIKHLIVLLKTIGHKYDLLLNTLSYIMDAVNIKCPEMDEFSSYYMESNNNNDYLRKAIEKLAEVAVEKINKRY